MDTFFDPFGETKKHGKKLPHWQQGEAVQFVTFRLNDSMPEAKLSEWTDERKIWLVRHPEPWDEETTREYHRRFSQRWEEWLDRGHGSCLLKRREFRKEVEEVLYFDEGTLAVHHAWVIMPNHVHLLFSPREAIEVLLQKWKGISAKNIGQGSIWQRGYRDTLIRDSDHFANAVRYIRRNPAQLRDDEYSLWQSERVREI